MATAKKDITITKHSITVKRTIEDDTLITFNEDHSFTLEPGHYKINIMTPYKAYTGTRLLDITEKSDPIIIEQSSSGQLLGDIHAEKGKTYLVQYFGNHWHTIQELDDSQYAITLTLQPEKK